MRALRVDDLIEERAALRDSATAALRGGRAAARLSWDRPDAWRDLWQVAHRLDWPQLIAPIDARGAGGGIADLAVVLEAVGASLAPIPLQSTASWCVPLLLQAAGPRARRALDRIATEGCVSVYVDATEACARSSGRIVKIPTVVEAPRGQQFVVRVGDTVVVVDRAESHAVEPEGSVDPSVPMGRVEIDRARLEAGDAVADVARALAIGAVGGAAELTGVARLALQMAVEHAGRRVQFDRPIATFQAVKHRLADLYVQQQRAVALIECAAASLDDPIDEQWCAVTHFACAAASELAVAAARFAVRIHGAMGVTWEHDAHLVLRRARLLAQRLGGVEDNYRRGAAAMTASAS